MHYYFPQPVPPGKCPIKPYLGETVFFVQCPLRNAPQNPIFKLGYFQ